MQHVNQLLVRSGSVSCSSTPAALGEAILRPIYTFCVSEGWACPSWSAMARADNPASSSRVAVVLRKSHPGDVHLLSREHQSGRTVSGSKSICMARRVA